MRKVRKISVLVEIEFDEPVESLALTLNHSSWVHALKDVTRYFIQESIDEPVFGDIAVKSAFDGNDTISPNRASLN